MSQDQRSVPEMPDPGDLTELAATWTEIADKARHLVDEFMHREGGQSPSAPDPVELELAARPFQTFFERVSKDPSQALAAQMGLWKDSIELWQRMGQRAMGMEAEPVIAPAAGDRRFKDEAWSDNPVFDFIKQSYLLTAKYMAEALPAAEGSGDKRAMQLKFHTQQFIDAMSPSNFAATNPAVLRETVETRGENLVQGLKHLLEDLERGKGQLRVRMTDLDRFEVGKNVGTTAGKVVFENELMQLIQYEPTTETVYRRPLVIIPPWINKFYILDLQPKNSFIKWAVDQGHTVFAISWVNPDGKLAEKGFSDYLTGGALAALDAVEQATGERDVNMVGYCLGGTLLACLLGYLAAHDDDRVKTATYFASLVDFSEPGELGVFIDEEHLDYIDNQMEKQGYLDGGAMAQTFNSLRANDLIWSFVVNNYLMGKEPFPFDLLYWNSDSTRMPRAMHQFYLRNMYLDNKLREPGGITLADTPIDLAQVKTPTYIVSPKEDHIAPWKSTYAGTQVYGGKVRFILAGSGHIAGIINPPAAKKYGYWTNDALSESADEWLAGAQQHEGSWWQDWKPWIRRPAGRKVPARVPGDRELSVIEDAPGRYVKVRDTD